MIDPKEILRSSLIEVANELRSMVLQNPDVLTLHDVLSKRDKNQTKLLELYDQTSRCFDDTGPSLERLTDVKGLAFHAPTPNALREQLTHIENLDWDNVIQQLATISNDLVQFSPEIQGELETEIRKFREGLGVVGKLRERFFFFAHSRPRPYSLSFTFLNHFDVVNAADFLALASLPGIYDTK